MHHVGVCRERGGPRGTLQGGSPSAAWLLGLVVLLPAAFQNYFLLQKLANTLTRREESTALTPGPLRSFGVTDAPRFFPSTPAPTG